MIFPENIRNPCAPPLPNLKHLNVTSRGEPVLKHLNVTFRGEPWKHGSELQDFFIWCAPSVETVKLLGDLIFAT